MRIARDVFDRIVRQEAARVIDALPAALREKASLVAILTADWPTPEQAESFDERDDIVGIYEGVSLVDRRVDDSATLPDRITLFRIPIAESCANIDEAREEIRRTILHELGHFFGFEELELEERGLR